MCDDGGAIVMGDGNGNSVMGDDTQGKKVAQWRRYGFFDMRLIKDGSDEEFAYLKDINVTCASSGHSTLVFGDSAGVIHMVTRQFATKAFKAFKVCVEHIQQMRESAVLVAIGSDEGGINPIIKVWNEDKQGMGGEPLCVRSMRAIIGTRPALVCSFRVHENLNLMAIGFDDGQLLLLRGEITRGPARNAARHAHHVKIEEKGAGSPITGIEFYENTHLFLATSVSVHSVSLQSLGRSGETVVFKLDDQGCNPACCAISERRRDNVKQHFIVGSKKGLNLYDLNRAEHRMKFKADKLLVSSFRDYLVCVVRDNEKTILNLYDVHNKYVAYSTPLVGITHVLPHWDGGELIVVTKQGRLFGLTEKSTEDRLGILFHKNQYELAVKLAGSDNYDGIVEIFRQYGDHLYAKGDHDGAVAQYVKTIGRLEESYVIRKLLDAQKIQQLTIYLEELHKRRLAKEDHTTLLLNCYTNINKTSALSCFIKRSDVQFDVEVAIRVCRRSELYQEALYLAQKYGLTDYYLKIQIDNLKDFNDAIRYIERLPFAEAEACLERYGKTLMDNSPEATTSLLCRLCTNFEGRKSPANKFIHIFVNRPGLLKGFLQQIIAELGDKFDISPIIYNTLLELELQEYKTEPDPARRAAKEHEIMCFLREKKNCYNTDLALGLCQINNFKAGILHLYEKAELYHQIVSFYTEKSDFASIFDLCSRFGDTDPTLWLHALLVLAQGGGGNVQKSQQEHYFMSTLSHIEKHSLLPPVMVVSIAAKSQTATLSLVKEYLVRQLSADGDTIKACEQSISELKRDTEKIREQIDNAKHKARIFQESKCSGCKIELELPSVHFLCGHSFHVNCYENYSDNAGCPSCAPENDKVLLRQRQMEDALKTLHEDFEKRFSSTDDVLKTVADFFAHGVFKASEVASDALFTEDIDSATFGSLSNSASPNVVAKGAAKSSNTETFADRYPPFSKDAPRFSETNKFLNASAAVDSVVRQVDPVGPHAASQGIHPTPSPEKSGSPLYVWNAVHSRAKSPKSRKLHDDDLTNPFAGDSDGSADDRGSTIQRSPSRRQATGTSDFAAVPQSKLPAGNSPRNLAGSVPGDGRCAEPCGSNPFDDDKDDAICGNPFSAEDVARLSGNGTPQGYDNSVKARDVPCPSLNPFGDDSD